VKEKKENIKVKENSQHALECPLGNISLSLEKEIYLSALSALGEKSKTKTF
jgi:hypothetical protein